MSMYGLNRAFTPQSIAIVGASPDASTLGGAVYANVIAAGFRGRIDPVNPKYPEIGGRAASPPWISSTSCRTWWS